MTNEKNVFTNRLSQESSPYLLQHANNPVDWYPWGDEAFETAQRLGRPIFLSIGYSTCHWCHVMEHESFEDLEVAEYLNANYICIKVDREERPDIDAIYMSAVQAMTGRGGWPMSVWLTNDKKPYYAGTYFPPRAGARGASFGFLELCKRLCEVFHQAPQDVALRADQVASAIQASLQIHEPSALPPDPTRHAVVFYNSRFDALNGGMRGQPKFPSSFPVRTLLRYYHSHPSETVGDMVKATLKRMASGGIYDHVGGGFHRYSTDAEWLVPHFEKMLYDNAILLSAYIEAYQAFGDDDFARVAHEICAYIEREMTSPDGVFYSATDADSVGPSGHAEEGYFFAWTLNELGSILSAEELAQASVYYQLTPEGNFEGRNILHVAPDYSEPASLSEIRRKLYEARLKRPQPMRDDKILASWNGLMISALAKASVAFNNNSYRKRAERAACFIVGNMFSAGTLRRVCKDGKTKQPGFLDDHAFLIAAFLDLYEASSNVQWLEHAIALERIVHTQFEDTHGGAYFMTSHQHEQLIAREKPAYDGAEPSGNSVHCLNLFRLAHLTLSDEYLQRGERCLNAFAATLERSPMSMSEMLIAFDFSRARREEHILITPTGAKHLAQPFLEVLRKRFAPHAFLLVVTEEEARAQERRVPALQGKICINNQATLYMCEEGTCQLPITNIQNL